MQCLTDRHLDIIIIDTMKKVYNILSIKIYFWRKYDIILDIGCGSGNVTKILSEKIQHNRIVALDVDPEMVKFSQQTLLQIL